MFVALLFAVAPHFTPLPPPPPPVASANGANKASMHPLGPEVHRGLHSVQWVSADKRHASHDFAWNDGKGREVKLAYEASMHEGSTIVDLASHVSIRNATIDDDIMTLSFSSITTREAFVGKYLRARDFLSGTGSSGPFMVRMGDVLSKDGFDVSFLFEHAGLTDIFRSVDMRYSHTLLAEDIPTRYQGKKELKNNMRRQRRRLGIFGWVTAPFRWFAKTAKAVIKLATKVVVSIAQTVLVFSEYVRHGPAPLPLLATPHPPHPNPPSPLRSF